MFNIKTVAFLLYIFSLFTWDAHVHASSKVKYHIFPLAPEGKELDTIPSGWSDLKINNQGYVIGCIFDCTEDPFCSRERAFVSHLGKNFKMLELPGNSCPYAINDQGIVVGKFIIDNEGCFHIFTYNIFTDEMRDLSSHPDIGNRPFSDVFITFINHNKIVVRDRTGAFIYDYNSQTVSKEIPQNFIYCNKNGQMIGGNKYWNEEEESPWFMEPDVCFLELGSLDQFKRYPVHPEIMSDHGFVAGIGIDTHGKTKGFLWGKDLGLKEIPTIGQGEEVIIVGINNLGQVIGSCERMEKRKKGSQYHGFIFDLKTGFHFLGPKGNESRPRHVNNRGVVVGMVNDIESYETSAFIWDNKHGMKNLFKMIPPNTGWGKLTEATYINDSGCIVGVGNYFGSSCGFILIPKMSETFREKIEN